MKFLVLPLIFAFTLNFCMAQSAPRSRQGPKWDFEARDEIHELAGRLAEQHQMTLLNSSVGDMVGSHKCNFAVSFMIRERPMTADEARPLVQELAQAFVNKVLTDPVFVRYNENEILSKGRPPAASDVGFKISFWDKNMDRPLHPYLAQVRFVEEQLLFYYADPKTQALQSPVVEPYSPQE